ncbi:MAG: RNA polymerase sigma-70 factor [Bacteroidales bacterium]|nr:RNA polymerase sigma-70 factor [Bacteroidales bacterium]
MFVFYKNNNPLNKDNQNRGNKLDETSFEELFRKHFNGLCFFAQNYVKDFDMAKEIVQESFINLWEKRQSIDISKSVKSYLTTSIRNKCLNYLRDTKKFNTEIILSDVLFQEVDFEQSDKLIEKELNNKINNAIDDLPEKCKEIFQLNRFENLKYKEIAVKLNISIKTVETQMSKALKHLRKKLKDYLLILIALLEVFID